MAEIWAQNSYCKRRKVGALLVKDRTIISDGYNGTPSGFENICEDENGVTKPYVLHAEANAITKVAKSGNSSEGATLFVTASPCAECAKLIIQAGISRVVYRDAYRLTDGIDLLKRAGIQVEQAQEKTNPHSTGTSDSGHRHRCPYYTVDCPLPGSPASAAHQICGLAQAQSGAGHGGKELCGHPQPGGDDGCRHRGGPLQAGPAFGVPAASAAQ